MASLGAGVPAIRAPVPKPVPHTLPRPVPGATLPAVAPAARGSLALPALSASTRSQLLANATQAGRGGISPVGRAIQKHAGRPGSFFTSAGGNAGRNTEIGRRFLDDLLAHPGTSVTHRVHKVHGQVIDVRLPNGAGAQFTGDGSFVGLLECYTPR